MVEPTRSDKKGERNPVTDSVLHMSDDHRLLYLCVCVKRTLKMGILTSQNVANILKLVLSAWLELSLSRISNFVVVFNKSV